MPIIRNSDKWACRQIAAALAAFGVSRVVTSPGSRNVPLLMAVARHGDLEVHSVIDERSAAFMALGMASVSGKPVALVCTSGTAMLNYAPALAEAYYRHIPLVAVTADRPAEWIDQDDSQTIRQPGALDNIVKCSYAINGDASTATDRWFVNRTLNDALLTALHGRKGPVHINVALSTPLSHEEDVDSSEPFRKISITERLDVLPTETSREMAAGLCGKKVLVVAGFNPPSAKVNRAMAQLAALPNVAVLAEGLSNIHAGGCVCASDIFVHGLIGECPDRLCPEILITFGGALVSPALKAFLRENRPQEHWHVGLNEATVDCFMSLTRRVEISPEGFFPRLAGALSHLTRTGVNSSSYAAVWHDVAMACGLPKATGWCAFLAVGEILRNIPSAWNLQLGNGMSVRYALANGLSGHHRVDCNRGVSGIDGSVSTAVGASIVASNPTLLITGDMSLQYDLAALSAADLPPRLKIVVLNNGGGGIFKFVKTTAGLPELPTLINGRMNLPLEQLARAYGFHYLRVCDKMQLGEAVASMIAEADRPVMMEVVTDPDADAAEMASMYTPN